MPSTRPRRSTSALSYPDAAEASELQDSLDKLRARLRDNGSTATPQLVQDILESVQVIRQVITQNANPGRMRDAFRNLNGFPTILDTLRFTSVRLQAVALPVDDIIILFSLLHSTLALLSGTLHEHWGNKKFFRTRVEAGGWISMHSAIEQLLESYWEVRQNSESARERVFGYLAACALDDDSLSDLFLKLNREIRQHEEPGPALLSASETIIRKAIGSRSPLRSPEVLVMLLDLWNGSRAVDYRPFDSTTLFTPTLIRLVAESSTHNLASLHGAGLLGKVLPLLLDQALHSYLLEEFRMVAVTLLTLGVADVEDAKMLYRNARTSEPMAETLRKGLINSFSPAYIHFDLSLRGYACVELPEIGKTFPPTSSSGYTLSVWLEIVQFDPQSHTTIFGAFDSSQTCFVLVYLEKDTRHLILQTSVTSSQPSVRFKSFSFEPSRWYHVCIVHKRPKTASSSKASLYVDGEFVEQVKAHYPSSPPLQPNTANASSTSANRHRAVQTFIGTPQDLATKLGEGVVSLQWRLGSACLFNDTLNDDLIAVHKELGPRYHGNYQDCLGSFQTYQASAALNLRNENLHPGKEEKSDIVAAIRSKASNLLPESKFLLNISPMMVLDDDDRNNVDETQLVKALSKRAAKKLRDATRGGRAAIAVNGAIPSINEALLHASGFGILTGSPVVVVPQSLDDASWRIGGCGPIALSLVDAAESKDEILRSLEILFGTVINSWRNSEAMERENGFGVLSSLLSAKLIKFSSASRTQDIAVDGSGNEQDSILYDILAMVLQFVGYQALKPEDSVINNPLAYRILLVDLDVWRSSSPRVQQLYYEQFATFGTGSKNHVFNAKRLSRMRITKKWLEALKGDTFYSDTIDHFLSAFRSLLSNAMSAEALRSLALFVTFAIHKGSDRTPFLRPTNSTKKAGGSGIIRRSTTPTSNPEGRNPGQAFFRTLSRLEVGVMVLQFYADLLCEGDVGIVKKFAKTVTNKWLLHLLSDSDPAIIILATRILARVLVVIGPSYVDKFAHKTGGWIIMRHRLRKWWNRTELWPLCFAIFFGRDVVNMDYKRPLDLYSLLECFPSAEVKVTYPGILPVIVAMLQNGLKFIVQGQQDPSSPVKEITKSGEIANSLLQQLQQGRARSVSLQDPKNSKSDAKCESDPFFDSIKVIQTVTRFLGDLHSNSQNFRDFAIEAPFVQELLFVLFPIVVSSDVVSPETELHSRDSSLTFNGDDVVIRPLSRALNKAAPIVRTATVEGLLASGPSRTQPLKRGSSFVLITSEESHYKPSSARLETVASPKGKSKISATGSHALVEDMLEMVIAVFSDQIFSRKDFQGIGLFMKVPPGFQEHQAYFETFILRNTISSLGNAIKLKQKLLWEPRVLTNLGRFCNHLDEAVYEGWFMDGADIVLDFIGEVLEYLQQPDIQQLKSIRLCSEIIAGMRTVISRIALLRLSEYDDSPEEAKTVAFLKKLTYWQMVLFANDASRDEHLRLLCYLLYTKLVCVQEGVRDAAANLWRIFLVQKPTEVAGVLHRIVNAEDKSLSKGFQKILELDNSSFLGWIDDHRIDLDAVFFGKLAPTWESFVALENRLTEEAFKARVSKRQEKLRGWVREEMIKEDVIRRHEINTDHWRSNIYTSEHLKRQRALQDQQDGLAFNMSSWKKMSKQLHRPYGLLDDGGPQKWQLDLTEGRNRMRLRVIPDYDGHLHHYQSKFASSKGIKSNQLALDLRSKSVRAANSAIAPSPTLEDFEHDRGKAASKTTNEGSGELAEAEDDFEIVEELEIESFEDKNRKVMRSLQRGDQVEHVHNISRIVGLEACEGLLIIGKMALYLLDNFFQRSDGEIVDAWQAPIDERDSYLQMISGRPAGANAIKPVDVNHETRSWRWEDILSISKRRFLFRDVAIEVFFVDGQSYLLTTTAPKIRDELYQRLLARAQGVSGALNSTNPEDQWRIESLRTPEDNPQTLGSRFTSVFAQGTGHPSTRKWIKGEISNFHYLMLVNTMAGRTFNDLTQYPVFPWILADYTSEELDLTNPKSFRDLSKPMGCQTPERQAEFRERYHSFAEMGDHNAPPFHYGTHYSSAMIVTSYLIRLQPFVQSYLLLQGGNFDHPDRLFYSLEKIWASASRDNMTDVRELIPEFYYLPEMLVNTNGYDFGSRQGNGGRIDNVALPPWAKGDPKIFVAKHREALESDHVSSNLHQWIDLVFGHKQRGDAALEATNVFHHLSYRGARNLDEIDDPVERMATIGIIHNFGQTPNQVFQRLHPVREDSRNRVGRLDTLADTLTRLPFPLLESSDRVSSLLFSHKIDRLFCSGPFRLNMAPSFDKYMEWGFVDGSVRFFTTEGNKPMGLFEHIHQGQISAACFADSRTLITAGTDCTLSVWTVIASSKPVDIAPKGCLFGHNAPVTTIATSRSFGTVLSASSNCQVLLWDLNRLDLIRAIPCDHVIECAQINDVTGTIMLCHGQSVALYTLNGERLLEQHACIEGDDVVTSCAFYEGQGHEYMVQNLIFTGHKRGAVNVWNIATHDGRFMLEHVKRLTHTDSAGYYLNAAISCILPLAHAVYTGDDEGRVYEWDCIQRQDGR